MQVVHFYINGKPKELAVQDGEVLTDTLRNQLGLTSVKKGCEVGECGACTVILNGNAVHSCLTMTGQLNGGDLLTVEGLEKDGELDILQKMFIKDSAVQCGFCTAGMLMSGKALLMRNPHPTDEEIRRAIAGNICRCSGYKEIRQAIKDAADAGKEEEA